MHLILTTLDKEKPLYNSPRLEDKVIPKPKPFKLKDKGKGTKKPIKPIKKKVKVEDIKVKLKGTIKVYWYYTTSLY